MCDVYELYNAKPNAIHSNNKGYCVILSNLPTMKQKVFSVFYAFMVYICGIFLLSMVYTVRPTLLYWWHIITGCPHWENIASSLRATDIQYLGLYTIHKIALWQFVLHNSALTEFSNCITGELLSRFFWVLGNVLK